MDKLLNAGHNCVSIQRIRSKKEIAKKTVCSEYCRVILRVSGNALMCHWATNSISTAKTCLFELPSDFRTTNSPFKINPRYNYSTVNVAFLRYQLWAVINWYWCYSSLPRGPMWRKGINLPITHCIYIILINQVVIKSWSDWVTFIMMAMCSVEPNSQQQ